MLQHYFHESYQYRAKRRNLRQFRILNNKTPQTSQQFICMSNGNAVQIYKLSSQSVDFYLRKEFMCNIAKLQVVPSLHHDSDYIFILDELGRFCFWRSNEGQRQTCNVIQKENTNRKYYREQLSPEEEEQFSGTSFRFDVKDTVGYLFFTVQNTLTLLDISVKPKQGLKIINSRTYQIPYTRFRYVNCLTIPTAKHHEFYLGIIQQQQQKTILKIHVLNPYMSSTMIDEDSLTYKIQKTNLLSFQSGQNDEIIVLTYDQISVYKYKQTQYLCNYRTRGNYGSVCYISSNLHKVTPQATYIHLGHDLTVFTKSRLHNYGALRHDGKNLLEGRGVLQSKYLGHCTNGQVMIGFITNFSEVYFLSLHQSRWKLVRRVQSLSSIFSLHEIKSQQNQSSMVVVHASLQDSSQITHIEITSPTVIQQQQLISNRLIESIEVVDEGESLVVCHQGHSSLLGWSDKDSKWVDHFAFNNTKEQILCCTGAYVVMTSGIYKYSVNEKNELALTLLFKEENILSACSNTNYIGYYTSQGTYKFYEIQSSSMARIRKNCVEEYIWHMLPNRNILVSAAYTQPGELRILPIQKVAKKIQLQTSQLVSSICSISYTTKDTKMIDQNSDETIHVDLIIGFHNGQVEIYSLERQRTIAKFNLGSQMVSISPYRASHVILYTSNKQYILSRNNKVSNQEQYNIQQVEFCDNSQQINKILYLKKLDKFLVMFRNITKPNQTNDSVSTLIQLRGLKLHKKLSDNELTLELKSSISLKTLFKTQCGEQVPFVEIIDNEFVFIALPEMILKYSIRTRELVKKQLHLLKQIVGIVLNKSGILVTGLDVMQSGSIVLFDSQDLSIKGTYNLSSSKPTSIKSFSPDSKYHTRFLVRHESYLSIFQIQPTFLITCLKTVNTKTNGYSMDINEKFSKILLSDPYTYLSVWDFDMEIASHDILPVSKYFGPFVINDCCWLDGSVVVGDRGGKLSVLQFNMANPNDLLKMSMTKVAQIYVGEEIFTLKRAQTSSTSISSQQLQNRPPEPSSIFYGTSSGSIGVIKTITEEDFKLLKQIQLDTIKYLDLKEHFSYEQWRSRIPKDDKLIDASIIKYYLEEFRHKIKITQEDFYNEVNQVYQNIIRRTDKKIEVPV